MFRRSRLPGRSMSSRTLAAPRGVLISLLTAAFLAGSALAAPPPA